MELELVAEILFRCDCW